MSAAASPAEMRAFIVERLVGDTGEPDQVAAAARALAERAVPAIVQGLAEGLAVPVAVEVAGVELTNEYEMLFGFNYGNLWGAGPPAELPIHGRSGCGEACGNLAFSGAK